LVNDLKKKKEIENWITDHHGNITDEIKDENIDYCILTIDGLNLIDQNLFD
jgi:hypothetical protein